MHIKVYEAYRTVVAICDSGLLGKTFEKDKLQLDVRENFYKGQEISAEALIPIITNYAKEDATFNIVGQEAVSTALKAGIISKEGIKKVQGIPYAMVLL